MSSSRERNDRTGPRRGRADKPFQPRRHARQEGGAEWIWGWHAVVAALANPRRSEPRRMVATPDRARQLTERFGPLDTLEVFEAPAIAQLTPAGAVHQGVALKSEPLEPYSIDEIGENPSGVLLMLDHVTDPQNVGAIFRSAAAFGARGVIVQDRHAPPLAGALAKAAAGAVDAVPHARVVNLSRALERLSDLGWRAVGLDGDAKDSLETVLDGGPTVLVLGSEGEGLRRLVAEHCDALGRIPMPGGFESLNVAAAAAVALYEASRAKR